jgi:hypothetical protein
MDGSRKTLGFVLSTTYYNVSDAPSGKSNKDTNAVVKSMTPGARHISRFIVLDNFDRLAAAEKFGNAVHREGVDVRFKMMFWLHKK